MDTAAKFVSVVARAPDTYKTGAVNVDKKYLLEKHLEANNWPVIVWSGGATREEALENAMADHLNSCTSDDERAGLMFHYQSDLLQEKIEVFRALDLRQATHEEILAHLEPIVGMHDVLNLTMNSGAYLYRARRLNKTPPYYFTAESELWAPPSEYKDNEGNLRKIARGRINQEGESMLYTSHNENALPSELRLSPGEEFCLIKYRVRAGKDLVLASIALADQDRPIFGVTDRDQSSWTEQAKANHGLIMGFLTDEFTRDVTSETKHLYRASVAIAHAYFKRPETYGYVYKSVAHKKGYNVAIRGELAQEVLEFVGLRIYKFLGREEGNMVVDPCTIQSDSIVDGVIQYTDGSASNGLDFFARSR